MVTIDVYLSHLNQILEVIALNTSRKPAQKDHTYVGWCIAAQNFDRLPSPSQPKVFKCCDRSCAMSFPTLDMLKNHRKSHNKDVVCDQCGDTFGRKEHLALHVIRQEGGKEGLKGGASRLRSLFSVPKFVLTPPL